MNGTPDPEKLTVAIADVDEKAALEIFQRMLEAGEDPAEVLEVCRRGMSVVGQRFESGKYFLSEMIMAAEIFNEILGMVRPRLGRIEEKPLGRIVLGTVQGDVHDIGKNIMIAMLEAERFQVIDLGVDVPPEKFIDAIKEYQPDVVGMSGLLTSAIESMKNTVESIRATGLTARIKIVIGGGRADEIAREYTGADAFADNAAKGVEIIKAMIVG